MVKQVSCMLFTLATLCTVPALAQPFPSKPIRVIIAIAAGSPTDVVIRTAGRELLNTLGQPLTIDNRPGGNQVIGSEACARAAGDGYTFCVVTNTAISVNPHIVSGLSYDPEKDFKPVTPLWFLINGVVATASLPARDGAAGPGTLGGWQLAVSAASAPERRAAAARLVAFLTSAEANLILALEYGRNPARRAVYEDPRLAAGAPFIARLLPALERARPRPVTPYYNLLADVLQSELSAAVAGLRTPEEALSRAQLQIDRITAAAGAGVP